MGDTVGTKAATTTAATITAAGFAVILHSTMRGNAAGSIGGTCLVMAALTLIVLTVIRRWVVDTREERRTLATATQQAQAEQTRYIAVQAALESERGRLTRDAAADRAHTAARLAAERKAMESEFEEQRARLAAESFRTGVEMERSGALKPQPHATGNLIRFPRQQPDQAPERERSRGHNVVGP